MCGTLVLSYTASSTKHNVSRIAALIQHLTYNSAKLISYTTVGILAGLVGSAFNIGGARGYVSLLAGLFMLLMGLNMLNVFPWLKHVTPRMPKRFQKVFYKTLKQPEGKGGKKTVPIVFGLMSGLMPCGPLQAMVIYAAGTGSFYEGGLSMFVFGLGTIPLMLAFGTFASLLTHKFKARLMKVSAVVVIVLGLVMLNRGLLLQGTQYNFNSAFVAVKEAVGLKSGETTAQTNSEGVQELKVDVRGGYFPNQLTVERGRPVRITFERHETNICSKEIVFPDFGVRKVLPDDGVAVVEFTPEKEGNFLFTCQMGMLFGSLKVIPPGGAALTSSSLNLPFVMSLFAVAPLLLAAYLLFRKGASLSAKGRSFNRRNLQEQMVSMKKKDLKVIASGLKLDVTSKSKEQIVDSIIKKKGEEFKLNRNADRRKKSWWAAIAASIIALSIFIAGSYGNASKTDLSQTGTDPNQSSGSPASPGTGGESGCSCCGGGGANQTPERATAKVVNGVQSIDIKVAGGYSPNIVSAKKGLPLKLNFIRNETSACSKYLVISDFGIQKELPDSGNLVVEITPAKPGKYQFTCGMNMLQGVIEVK